MTTEGFQERRGRETRLLLLVVGVSIAVLLLLARFRFPEADLSVTPATSSPLAGLAGQASFDELALTMNALLGRVSPRLAIVELHQTKGMPPGQPPGPVAETESVTEAASALEAIEVPERDLNPEEDRTVQPAPPGRLAVALRVRSDLALVHVPAGWQVVHYAGSEEPIEVVAADAPRRLAVVRTASETDFRIELSTGVFMGMAYVGAFDATPSGPTVEPLFIGRIGTRVSERWPAALYALGTASNAVEGTFVFSFDGQLIGLAVRDPRGPVIVPASVLEAVVEELATEAAVDELASPEAAAP